MNRLLAAFLGSDGAGEPAEPSDDELPHELASALDRARSAWPGLEVDDETFGRALSTRVPAGVTATSFVRRLHAADLYLVLACGAGDAAAQAILEARYLPDLLPSLRRLGLSATGVDEALQLVREELLVAPPGGRPRILSYGARGSLKGWLRAVATRTGLRSVGSGPRIAELHESTVEHPDDDLELAYLKRTYGTSFQAAFRLALQGLPGPDRVLLKQRLQHHLSIEQLGALHGVHGSTVSRWVTDARERLVAATRDAMMRELKVGRPEVSSILRLIRSELDITFTTSAGSESA
jgi:RNA polymerase sigma-70 factor (ECF subfamily)